MQKMQIFSWAPKIYTVGLVLALVCIVPVAWFPFQLAKIALAAVCMSVAALFFVLGGSTPLLLGKKSRWAFLVFILPGAYVLSWLFSTDRTIAFSGHAVEADTVLFILVCSLAFVFASAFFRSVATARFLIFSVAGSAAFAAVFQYLVIVFGQSLLPLQVFFDRSTNLVGKWNDLGLLVGLLLVFCLVWLDFSGERVRSRRFGLVAAGAVALFILLAIVQFPLVWMFLSGFSLLLAAWRFFKTRKIAWVSFASAALSTLLIFYGVSVNTALTKVVPVSSLEVRPSAISTLSVFAENLTTTPLRALVGTGPQTFGESWSLQKPVSVNESPFWNLDFVVGYSTALTAVGTVGLFGALAWFVPLALMLVFLVRVLRVKLFSPEAEALLLLLGLSALYVWLSVVFYIPGQTVLLLVFVLCGAVLGFSFKQEKNTITSLPKTKSVAAHTQKASASKSSVREGVQKKLIELVLFLQNQSLTPVFGGLLVLFFVASSFVLVRRVVGESFVNQGALALSQNHNDVGLRFAVRAYGIEHTNDALSLMVSANTAKISAIISTNTPTPESQAALSAAILQGVSSGRQLLRLTPLGMGMSHEYHSYMTVAKMYEVLASVGAPNAYENAKQLYQNALEYNPKNPQIWYLLAQLDEKHGDEKAALAEISQALTVKPNYTEAIMFMVQYYVSKKDAPNALRAAAAAVQSDPHSPAALFQLGVLYYTLGDTANAIVPLQKAIAVQADYANAKYFLGLAFAGEGRVKEALLQFDDLARSNPDNATVASIRKNLNAGRSPFQNTAPTQLQLQKKK